MPRVKLLKPGFVKGNAKVGSTHIVSQEEAELLVADGAAVIDETETLQAQEIEGQREELVALAEKLTAKDAELEKIQAEGLAKDATIAELSFKLGSARSQTEMVEALTRALETKDAQLAELEAAGATLLPSDFPERASFVKAGIATLEGVAAKSDAELEALEGVGKATVKKARDYTAQR